MKISFKTIRSNTASATTAVAAKTSKSRAITTAEQYSCPADNSFCKVPSYWKSGESTTKMNRSCFMCWLIRQPVPDVSRNTQQWLDSNNGSHPLFEHFKQAKSAEYSSLTKPQRRGGRSARLAIKH